MTKKTTDTWISRLVRRFRREDGSSTIEFVILVPIFLLIFLSTFEIGVLMVRQVMLDRATDLAVRSLRLGQWPTDMEPAEFHSKFKDYLCDIAAVIKNCNANMYVELSPVSKDSWAPLPTGTKCVNKLEDVEPSIFFQTGVQHELMMVRVCVMTKPIFPLSGIGAQLPNHGDYYSLSSLSAFVNEPS